MSRDFTLTEDHIKLLSSLWIEWDDHCYEGVPCVDIKRPYGNKGLEEIGIILGWKMKNGNEFTDIKQFNFAKKIHKELHIALQICLVNKSFIAGRYVKTDEYNSLSWIPHPIDSMINAAIDNRLNTQ